MLQLYQDGWGTEMTDQECLGLLKEAQSRMNVLQLYQDKCCAEKDNEGLTNRRAYYARLLRIAIGYALLYFR